MVVKDIGHEVKLIREQKLVKYQLYIMCSSREELPRLSLKIQCMFYQLFNKYKCMHEITQMLIPPSGLSKQILSETVVSYVTNEYGMFVALLSSSELCFKRVEGQAKSNSYFYKDDIEHVSITRFANTS